MAEEKKVVQERILKDPVTNETFKEIKIDSYNVIRKKLTPKEKSALSKNDITDVKGKVKAKK